MSAVTARRKARRNQQLTPGLPLVISHHGLEARYAKGEVEVDHNAPDEPDPNRTISRARVVPAYGRLHSRGSIKDHQREAADKYAILREQEICGGGRLDGPGRAVPAWQKGHPILTQVQASAALRSVHEVLGTRGRVVVTLLIIENMNAKELAERFAVDERWVMGWITAALERMAEHWGMTPDSGT